MNKLTTADRVQIIASLTEGNSLRATSRMAGVSINTVTRLLEQMGAVCRQHHDENVRGLATKRVQCDEVWSFCYSKEKNVPDRMKDQPGVGSVWTWTGIDADSKLMIAYHVGSRDAVCGQEFMLDVASRLENRVQLTTDGHRAYLDAVPQAFGTGVDYAMLIKIYGEPRDGESRYSPCDCIGIKREKIIGNPKRKHVSTSFVERSNLTMRMGMRRFTRLTNGYSKKLANLEHAVAIHFMHYNFCRKHQSLGTSPAVFAGLADHVWSLEELIGLLEQQEQAAIAAGAMKRGKYRPRQPISN